MWCVLLLYILQKSEIRIGGVGVFTFFGVSINQEPSLDLQWYILVKRGLIEVIKVQKREKVKVGNLTYEFMSLSL